MARGMTRQNQTKETIFRFLKDKEEMGFEQIAEFCGKASIYRNTVKKYLDEMKKSGYVKQSPDGRHPYSLTPKGKTELVHRNLIEKVNSMSPEERERLKKIIDNQKRTIDELWRDFLSYEDTVAELEDWSPIEKHLHQVGPAPLSKEEGEKLARAQEEWEKQQKEKNVPNCYACGKLIRRRGNIALPPKCLGPKLVSSWVCPEGRGSNGKIQDSTSARD